MPSADNNGMATLCFYENICAESHISMQKYVLCLKFIFHNTFISYRPSSPNQTQLISEPDINTDILCKQCHNDFSTHQDSWIIHITGDPLHSQAAFTQPCNVYTHSRAHCSPGHGCVNNGGTAVSTMRHGCVQVPGCVEGHSCIWAFQYNYTDCIHLNCGVAVDQG